MIETYQISFYKIYLEISNSNKNFIRGNLKAWFYMDICSSIIHENIQKIKLNFIAIRPFMNINYVFYIWLICSVG